MSIWEFVQNVVFWLAFWSATILIIDKIADIRTEREWKKTHNKKEGER